MKKLFLLLVTHALALVIGFAAGVYVLPILVAPPAPDAASLASAASTAEYRGTFRRDLAGSDALHWGEGTLMVGRDTIVFEGRLAPGPDYKLYLAPEFVEDEAGFVAIRDRSVRVGDVRTFTNFLLDVPASIDPGAYTTAVVWCESFGEFISAASYR